MFFEACDICNPVSVVWKWFEDFKNGNDTTSFENYLESSSGHTLSFYPNMVKYRFKIFLKESLTRSSTCADPGRGGGFRTPPPPWDLSEVGSCVDIWWVGEGVQRLFLFFFLARSAHQFYTQCKYLKKKSESLASSKRISPSPVIHTIPGFHESTISMFILSKITRFYTI